MREPTRHPKPLASVFILALTAACGPMEATTEDDERPAGDDGSDESALSSLPGFVQSTAPLSMTELSVARAYLVLFGRAPELDGLAYWTRELGERATVATAVDHISRAVAGQLLVPPPGPDGDLYFLESVYGNVLGKSVEDDREGIQYWARMFQQGRLRTRGELAAAILEAAEQTTDRAIVIHRQLVVEAAARAQKARGRSLDYQSLQTLARRVRAQARSFETAMVALDRATRGVSAPALAWETLPWATSVARDSAPLVGVGARKHAALVWYNRDRQMMLAHAIVPRDCGMDKSPRRYRVVVAVHGGGWREGSIERLQKYGAAFAQAGYVVLAPSYRLSSLRYQSPAQENDLEDFLKLVYTAAPTLQLDTSKVLNFDESAGGHLLNLLGTRGDRGCVSSLYPQADLTQPAPALAPYVNAYLTGSLDTVAPASVALGVSPAELRYTRTRFQILPVLRVIDPLLLTSIDPGGPSRVTV